LIAAREVAHNMTELILALETAYPAIELLVGVALVGNARAFERAFLSVDEKRNALVARDDRLEREPP
jgi:hypothetical protein